MLIEDQYMHNKSIMVGVLGAPNVGKSSLANSLLGFDLSIVTNKPQTTRNHFHCVFNVEHTEVVLIDTPGVHQSNFEMNKRMNGQVKDGIDGADINFLLFDSTTDILAEAKNFKRLFDQELKETWVLFTKSDLVDVEKVNIDEWVAKIKEIIPAVTRGFVVSSKSGENIELLKQALNKKAAPGPHLYPRGDVSNKNERFFVTEYIREQAFKILKDEIPYEVAVVIDEYKDFRDKEGVETKLSSHISASILVNRPSQRAIVIGAGGQVIKEIGTKARQKIEAMVGGQVHLNLHVKVSEKWFNNNYVLDEIGLPRVQNSTRVWRKK